MKRFLRHPMAVVGGLILLVVVAASVAAPLLSASDPVKPSFGKRLQSPRVLGGTSAYPLGMIRSYSASALREDERQPIRTWRP